MIKTLIAVGSMFALAGVLPALAQEGQDQKSSPPAATEQAPSTSNPMSPGSSPSASDSKSGGSSATAGAQDLQNVKGWKVWSSDGQNIGEVREVRSAEAGGESKLVIETSQFLGLGTRTYQLDANQVTKGNERLDAKITASEAKNLPAAPENKAGGK